MFYYYFTTLLSYFCLNIGSGYSCSAQNKQTYKPSYLSNSDWHYYLRYSFLHYYLRYSFLMFVTMTSENLMMTIVKRRLGTILACAVISGKKCVLLCLQTKSVITFTNKKRREFVSTKSKRHNYTS